KDRGSAPAPAGAPAIPAAAGGAHDAWMARASWAVIAAAGAALLGYALARHPVGDYYTESDFYGGYVEGARLIQHGRVDPARYLVVGPGYEVALALAGWIVRDPFVAAKLLSVAAAIATLALWSFVVRRRAGPAAGLWLPALLAVTPTFVRYAYSVTTDMCATALAAGAIALVVGARGRRAPLLAGAVTALAALTRYSAVALVPAALLCYAWLAVPEGLSRRRACALYLAGFAAIVAPWVAFSLARGSVPGSELLRNFGFYSNPEATRNIQDRPGAFTGEVRLGRSLGEMVRGGAGPMLGRILRNVPEHLARDARELLGWPAAALCLAGIPFALLERAWRRLVPVWAFGAVLFASLLPVFYSDRYSLPLAPIYLVLGAVAAASPRGSLVVRPPGLALKHAVVAVVLVLSALGTLSAQRFIAGMAPVEVLGAGRALAAVATPGERVVSRKGHIGYYSGLEVVPFPRVDSLTALAAYCRERGARYLYYSWYEGRLRPEFAYLLDTTAAIPGLSRIYYSDRNPAVVYRIGPEFGAHPSWYGNDLLTSLHTSRALARVLPDSLAAPHWVLLGALALDQGRAAEALDFAGRAARGRPRDPQGWALAGEALRAQGRFPEAREAYETALEIDPGELASRLGLGWVELTLGNPAAAARAWRPVAGRTRDPVTLRAMAATFERQGDLEAARAARAAMSDTAR
ncbi:MAG TPA: tetratricopeptide repeat protein, partial [Candidatus Eisenbacteria bacterium]